MVGVSHRAHDVPTEGWLAPEKLAKARAAFDDVVAEAKADDRITSAEQEQINEAEEPLRVYDRARRDFLADHKRTSNTPEKLAAVATFLGVSLLAAVGTQSSFASIVLGGITAAGAYAGVGELMDGLHKRKMGKLFDNYGPREAQERLDAKRL